MHNITISNVECGIAEKKTFNHHKMPSLAEKWWRACLVKVQNYYQYILISFAEQTKGKKWKEQEIKWY